MPERAVAVLVGESEDGQTITLMMNDRDTGELLAYVDLGPPELENLIEHLAQRRATLSDEVPREIDPGTRSWAIPDPLWRGEYRPDLKAILLGLRHPGFGWTSWVLPDEEAKKLGRCLLDLPAEGEGQPKQ